MIIKDTLYAELECPTTGKKAREGIRLRIREAQKDYLGMHDSGAGYEIGSEIKLKGKNTLWFSADYICNQCSRRTLELLDTGLTKKNMPKGYRYHQLKQGDFKYEIDGLEGIYKLKRKRNPSDNDTIFKVRHGNEVRLFRPKSSIKKGDEEIHRCYLYMKRNIILEALTQSEYESRGLGQCLDQSQHDFNRTLFDRLRAIFR